MIARGLFTFLRQSTETRGLPTRADAAPPPGGADPSRPRDFVVVMRGRDGEIFEQVVAMPADTALDDLEVEARAALYDQFGIVPFRVAGIRPAKARPSARRLQGPCR